MSSPTAALPRSIANGSAVTGVINTVPKLPRKANLLWYVVLGGLFFDRRARRGAHRDRRRLRGGLVGVACGIDFAVAIALLTGDVAVIGGRVDHAVHTTGVVAALSQAHEATWPAGPTLPAQSLVAEEKTPPGSYLGSCVPRREVPRFIAPYQAGSLPVRRASTLDEINAGFARLRDGGAVRQVIAF
ncbi:MULTISPECIES: hypothetical protein [Amycolatopsis]|uniref:hypothetical protein n=1 Tax=Amycolatopsis TaxID=1813 RepID=UPI000835F881|nr:MULTISPECIES: hypothetical protein [Amycolatopsis]